jgi:hypothetical protein
MAQGLSFWDWYARVNDDLRHHLIERGWHGQQTRDDTFQRDVAAMSSIEADQYRDRTAEAGTQNPKLPDALQGIAGDESDTENVKDVMKHFYGQRTTASTAESQERSLTEYYRDRIQDR